RKRSLSTGRLLHRPHQHKADAPVDGFVTALHTTGAKTLFIFDPETGKQMSSVNQLGAGPQVITTSDM
ncbi:amine dehydrogenase large subunit, partial [Methylorubrum aminovorans]|uniref:amine dehydrogenase large subunit n=1 Tax=Methylorubrum aminovorans TaxID=269069 RepID=UPI003C2E5FD5